VAFTGEEGQGRLAAALKVLVSRRCFIALQAAAVYRLGPTAVQVLRAPSGLLDHQLEAQWAGAADVPEEEGATVAVACESGATDAPGPLGQSVRDMLCRPEMRLTIGGVELNPAVWRHAFDPEGYQWDSAQDKAAAVALGHAAHLVDRLAAYLGVQLRYPVLFRGSASAILDNYPPAGNW